MAAKPKALKSPLAKMAPKIVQASIGVKMPRVPVAPPVGPPASHQNATPSLPPRDSKSDGGQAKTKPNATSAPALKMKDLIDKVVGTTGAKKADVRQIVDATLAALGDALSNGDTLNLPPFGRAKVSRAGDASSGKAMTVKLRRPSAAGASKPGSKQALADLED